jgi:CheY-like chemotaxis protein
MNVHTLKPEGGKATVMVVEDDALIAMDLAMQVEALGLEVMGPFYDTASALAQLETAMPDAALLDFNLGRLETSRKIADTLYANGIPFTFLSGYTATDLNDKEGTGDHPVLSKPVTARGLEDSLREILKLGSGNAPNNP